MSKGENRQSIKELTAELNALAAYKPGHFDQGERAERARKASQLIHKTFAIYQRKQNKDDERALWLRAVELSNQTLDAAYEPGFWEAYEQLKAGDSSALEPAIKFLENDPWFFRSGYVKVELIRLICHTKLTNRQIERLGSVVVNAIDTRDRREFRTYCKLARYVHTHSLGEQIKQRLGSAHDTRRRAQWVMDSLAQQEQKAKN